MRIPPSKSMAHRLIICSGFARLFSDKVSKVDNIAMSDDIVATIRAMDLLEKISEEVYNVKSRQPNTCHKKNMCEKCEEDKNTYKVIDCGESGSSLRFIIPILSIFADKFGIKNYRLDTRGRLLQRPLDPYYDILDREGIEHWIEGKSLYIRGMKKFSNTIYEIDGNISSQFISGLLFALPLMDYDSEIVVKGTLESKGYVDMTIEAIGMYGIYVENLDYKVFKIGGNQSYIARDTRVEGDYSQAAFYLVGNALGNDIEVEGLDITSLQLDKEINDIIEMYESRLADMSVKKDIQEDIMAESTPDEIEIDASNIPDIVPIVSLLASTQPIKTIIRGVYRLRIKESDRLEAIVSQLSVLGYDLEVVGDGRDTKLIINGNNPTKYFIAEKSSVEKKACTEKEDIIKKMVMHGKKNNGQENLKTGDRYYLVDSFSDHRIAMTLAIAATISDTDVVIKDAHVVSKSYPDFWEEYARLGGEISEFDLGQKV